MKLSEILKGSSSSGREIENEEYFVGYSEELRDYKVVEDQITDGHSANRVIFVDGKVRHLLFNRFGNTPFLLSQVVIGASIWEEGKGVYIPDEYVYSEFVFCYHGGNVFPDVKKIGSFPVKVIQCTKPDFKEFVLNRMYTLELELSWKLSEKEKDGLVVKDGTLRPIYEVEGLRPIGFVKNIGLNIPYEFIEKLNIGERSRMIVSSFGEYYTLHSVVRIGRNSFVRLDCVVERVNKDSVIDIGKKFTSISKILPELTLDVKYGRLPENIYPIQALEKKLSAYLYTPGMLFASIV